MITFRSFLAEAIPSSKLDASSKKDKMRAVISRTFKDRLPEMESYFVAASPRNFKSRYNAFVLAFPAEARKIDSMRDEGVGPGELIAYFVFDDISIGGGKSSIDLFKNGEPFAEVKAGDGNGDGGVQDFKLDTEHSASGRQLIKNLDDFNNEYRELTGTDLPGWKGGGEASTTSLRNWRHVDLVDLGAANPDDSTVDEITSDWVSAIKDAYVKDKYFMLVNRKNLRVHYFGQLGTEMVDLLRTTRGQPKAAVSP